jgi:hypothetical protein
VALNNAPSQQATLPTPPPTLPPWAKIIWYIAETIAIGNLWQQYDFGQQINPVPTDAGGPDAGTWRRFQVITKNTASNNSADNQIFTFDLVNYTNGFLDNTWTAGDYSRVQTQLQAFFTAYAPAMSPYLTFSEARAYIMAFNALGNPKPFAESGAPEWVQAFNTPGTGTGGSPAQGCTTVTEFTPARRHWGRQYLPTLAGSAYVATTGRVNQIIVDSVVQQWHAFVEGVHLDGLQLVIPMTQSNKVATRTLNGVTAIGVDDVPDVVRRRRLATTNYRNQLPVP